MHLEIYDGNIVGVGVNGWRLAQLAPAHLETEDQTQSSAKHLSSATCRRLLIMTAVRQ